MAPRVESPGRHGTACPVVAERKTGCLTIDSADGRGKRGLPQIEFGLLTNREGCPVTVDVFEGNMADPMTVAAQVDKLSAD